MRTPIEIDVVMGLRAIPRMHLVNLTITLMLMAGYAPVTYQVGLVMTPKPTMFLRISYEYLPDVIEDLVTLSFLDVLHQEELYGGGFAIEE